VIVLFCFIFSFSQTYVIIFLCYQSGRRLPSPEGFAALLLPESMLTWKSTRKRVAPMNILEILALLGYGLACLKFGYELGKNAKK
jgi:hypothetical protein